MIGHDHPSLGFVKPLLTLAVTNSIRHMPRDSRIAHPERPTALVQSAILRDESMTRSRIPDGQTARQAKTHAAATLQTDTHLPVESAATFFDTLPLLVKDS